MAPLTSDPAAAYNDTVLVMQDPNSPWAMDLNTTVTIVFGILSLILQAGQFCYGRRQIRTTWYMVQRSKSPTSLCHSVCQRASYLSTGGLRVACARHNGRPQSRHFTSDLPDRTEPLTDMDGRLRQALSAGETLRSSPVVANGEADRACLIVEGTPPSIITIGAQDTWNKAARIKCSLIRSNKVHDWTADDQDWQAKLVPMGVEGFEGDPACAVRNAVGGLGKYRLQEAVENYHSMGSQESSNGGQPVPDIAQRDHASLVGGMPQGTIHTCILLPGSYQAAYELKWPCSMGTALEAEISAHGRRDDCLTGKELLCDSPRRFSRGHDHDHNNDLRVQYVELRTPAFGPTKIHMSHSDEQAVQNPAEEICLAI
ncbi:hypothetical protein J7T55_002024 [Diaporthe amygdali]|uniref:uncharacterized protein n=1 Tax=Phomopsis amygdali TaxID=1214568 RepID=UPI0022FE2B87|nr:uncharacterized protein J7T55_002024 [Diaporthe amygdali]KAJ0117824.1 hypothetical protein J7T55_002024 [Diaporthe amygdali]